MADEKFNYTSYSFNDIVDSTVSRAIALIERTGGSVDGDSVTVELQEPRQAKLEAWNDYGSPQEEIRFDDDRWQWQGPWQRTEFKPWRTAHWTKVSGSRGAEASISFEGSGAATKGILLPSGGKAEVYLDGEFSRTIDVYPDETIAKTRESIWHEFDLGAGTHTLRIVVLGESYGESTGTDISVSGLLVFD